MIEDRVVETLRALVLEAKKARIQARLAYEFTPSSYTFAAMSCTSRALDEAELLLAEIDAPPFDKEPKDETGI